MLVDSNDKKFKLKKSEIDISKKVFFLIHNCCDFTNDVKSSDIFFNQSDTKNLNSLFFSIFKNLKKINIYLNNLIKKINS